MDNLAADFEINPNNPLNAEYELGEGVGFDCSFELYAAGTVWGSIDGDINNQTDLINLLNTKVNLTSFEELSQTVTNNYNELTGDIADLTGTVTDNYNTLSGQISDLSGVVNDNYTSLDNRLTTAEGSILDLTDTVSDNYTELNDKITDNTDDITTIQNTINSYGDIVSYNAVYFATANQGSLADTALQPNDNISELTNNVGYITSASLPTVNNATITIQKNGADVGTFTLNQSNNATLNITVPTQASDIGAMPDTTTIEDLTTTAQLNALNSGATTSNIGQISTNQNNIADIRSLIPLQASTSNQLADKGFVNSSIATNTANFIGTFNSVAELEAYSGTLTNNDYAFVATTDSAGNTLYDRYKYNADTQEWLFEYELNNSSFTAQQWASINSGITSGDVTLIGTALQPNDNISELINDADYITSASLPTVNNGTLDIQVNGTSIGTFTANQSGNTTANIVVPDSATWGNITGTLSNQIDLQNALDSKYDASNPDGYITLADLPTNYVTTNTAQDISGRKTFLGEKAIYFKQNATTDKLGFTLYNPSNAELGALEYRPNTINGNALLALNCPQTGSNYVGFRYWSGINVVAPRPTTNGNYFIPVNVTDGTNTVTANNNGTLNISSLLPDVSNFVTNSSLATTLADYVTNANLTATLSDYVLSSSLSTVATSGSYNDLTNKPTIPSEVTESTVSGWGFTKNVGTVTSVNSILPDSNGNVSIPISGAPTWGEITGNISYQTDLQSALDSKLQNKATGTGSLNIIGNATNYARTVSIGAYSYVPTSDAIAVGYGTQAKSQYSMAIGGDNTIVGTGSTYATALGIGATVDNNKTRAIQIGEGTNSTQNTLQIGFGTNYNYTLLDGTTGLIPDARLSTNIARTSQIVTPTYDSTNERITW